LKINIISYYSVYPYHISSSWRIARPARCGWSTRLQAAMTDSNRGGRMSLGYLRGYFTPEIFNYCIQSRGFEGTVQRSIVVLELPVGD